MEVRHCLWLDYIDKLGNLKEKQGKLELAAIRFIFFIVPVTVL